MTASISTLQPVKKRPKVHHQVVDQLQQLITSGVLREGDKLPGERALMAQLGVGRPAIREAMLSLEKSGLLRLSNGERAQVSRPTPEAVLDGMTGAVRLVMAEREGLRNFQAAREFFEIALVRHAAQHATRAQLDTLAAALKVNKKALGDMALFEQTDVAYHFEIAKINGNPNFSAMHNALSGWLLEQRNVVLHEPAADRRAYRFHERIFQAIEAGDADAAEKQMKEHLTEVAKVFWVVRDKEGARREDTAP